MLNNVPKFQKIYLLVAFIAISGMGVDVAGAQRDALEPIRIQLRWSHQFQFAGYYASH